MAAFSAAVHGSINNKSYFEGSDFDANCKTLFINEHILTVFNSDIFQCITNLNLISDTTKSDLHYYSTRYNYQLVVSNFKINKST